MLEIRRLHFGGGRGVGLLSATLALTLWLSAAGMGAAAQPHPAAAPPPPERLVTSFSDGPGSVTTIYPYSGAVTITVAGVGQAAGPSFTDAFYMFTEYNGDPLPPFHPDEFILSINYALVDDFLPGGQAPIYQPDHRYTFAINAPGGRLTFGVLDFGLGDNSGRYVIDIGPSGPSTLPYYSQRDPAWVDHPLASAGGCPAECDAIGACGSALTSAAMLLAAYGSPDRPDALSDCMGECACPFDWAAGAGCSGGRARLVYAGLFSWVRLIIETQGNRRPVILGMRRGDETHWVAVAAGQRGEAGKFLVHDPWPLQGADTSLTVYERQGYVFDWIVVYEDAAAGPAGVIADLPGRYPSPAATAAITDAVRIYHVEETAVVVRLSATGLPGPATEMLLWTDSDPDSQWQPYGELGTVGWQPGDHVYARFRDDEGRLSADYSETVAPAFSPPPDTFAALHLPVVLWQP